MSADLKSCDGESRPAKSSAYDPNDPMNVEDRQYDDTSEGIDWDEIIASTQDDFEAGRYSFNSADYPNHEAAMVALQNWVDAIVKEALNELASVSAHDAARP